jgi:hypothetical protein
MKRVAGEVLHKGQGGVTIDFFAREFPISVLHRVTIAAGACHGKVGGGLPIRTCAN